MPPQLTYSHVIVHFLRAETCAQQALRNVPCPYSQLRRHARVPLQLTDDLVEASFPGVGSVESLRSALADSTAAQREEDQKEAVHEALIRAVADCVDADIPDSAIRQLAENEYQAKLHEIQLKASPAAAPLCNL